MKSKFVNHNENGSRATADDAEGESSDQLKEREQWRIQKAALQRKFGNEKWDPRKRLSPDAIEGIRALHAQFPDKYTTPMLANQFEVSPEAIRRILKSKWRPTTEEAEERNARWDRRGEKIWSQMVELGVKPPKKWREMGIGKRESPQSNRSRAPAPKGSSFDSEDIPWADDSLPQSDVERTPLADRII
ncbi:MAG: Required for respiratory growth protein 9 mitochondrial [Watsoniomyces obsoletus]|nr:MAG: Required for respiratory growth protein 9 mitochondrial [Watsoniomyces obsoletus]